MIAATAAFAAAGARRAQAADTIRVGGASSEESSLLFMASERGAFKDAGLDVALAIFPTNQLMQGLLGGSLDLGLANTGAIALAYVHALPLYLIAPAALYTPRQPISHVAVAPGSSIRGARDLAGKTIGMLAIRDMAQAAAMNWLDAGGGDAKSVRFIEVPPLALAVAVQNGRVDAAIINEPHFTDAKGTVREIGLTYAAVAGGKPFQATGVTANKAWADANPSSARRFAGVIYQTAQWANRNPDEAAALIAKLMKIDLGVVRSIPRVQWAEAPSTALVQPVIDVMAKYAILPRRFQAQEVFAPGV
jgi:ABC-type nitrate/sulfonate/bicarbonate transport system substrate-binding protein